MAPPSRRAVLAATTAALLPAAGCSVTSTPTPADARTPPPGECDATAPPHPDTGAGLPDPKPYPDPPGDLTARSVTDFLRAYETAYTYNGTLAEVAADGDCLERLAVNITGVSVERSGWGFTATVGYFRAYTGTNCPGVTGTDTPTPLAHSDLSGEASYRVADRFLVREGVVRACWQRG